MEELYYSPEKGFLSADKFARLLKEEGVKVSRKEITRFLRNQKTWQLNKQQNLPSRYSTYWAANVGDNYQIDLMDYDRFTIDGKRYILCLIDVKSRYANARALSSKNQRGYVKALTEMMDEMGRYPTGVSADQEFNTAAIRKVFKDVPKDRFWFSEPDQLHKNPIVERWHRTLAGRLQRWRQAQPKPGIAKWPSVLAKIVQGYNNSYHRTIDAKPADVFRGKAYNRQAIIEVDTTFELGDRVRYRLAKPVFRKGDRITFSRAVYVITGKRGKRYELTKEGSTKAESKTRAEYELVHAYQTQPQAVEDDNDEPAPPERQQPPERRQPSQRNRRPRDVLDI
ncbi:MAG: hypothetical protein EBU96_05470 [Actinobacteria bacterium]|nr:hypothetical protein [Actinomycetota bacterium]